MGSGKNGSFDTVPDLRQWAILLVLKHINDETEGPGLIPQILGSFISFYLQVCRINLKAYLLQPIECHGLWNGKTVFGNLPRKTGFEGKIAVLTRATIRLNRLGQFWKNVPAASAEMKQANGFETSYGIGEIPWIKQATFSIWRSKADMQAFAYGMQHHREVIRKTRENNWYSEEMFARFKVLAQWEGQFVNWDRVSSHD